LTLGNVKSECESPSHLMSDEFGSKTEFVT
jgi:hypothetical protein